MVFPQNTPEKLTERHHLVDERTRQIEIQIAELQKLNQLKEDFLTTTSHEMRTPLSNIKMAITMLEEALKQQGVYDSAEIIATKSIAEYISILREQCEHQLNLVDNLLNMRIIDAGLYPIELSPIQLQNWLPQLIKQFQECRQTQDQILTAIISPELPPLISDLNILTQIVLELIQNACKHSPPQAFISVKAQGNHVIQNLSPESVHFVRIIISNSGVEIPTEEQSLIFEPFYRIPKYHPPHVDTSNPWRYEGTGLGLALVKKLVEYLQGTINVTSSQGWTSFTVEIRQEYNLEKFADQPLDKQ